MNFDFKIYRPEHKEILDGWCRTRNIPLIRPEALPGNGLLISHDGKPIVIGFLFSSDTDVAVIAHIMSDPSSLKPARREAVEWLLEILGLRAVELGFKQLNIATNLKSLGERFEEFGFEKVDENVTLFRRTL